MGSAWIEVMIRRLLLMPFSILFGLLVDLKNLLYDRGLIKQSQLDRPVISVGNLSVGGTGKSPVVSDLTSRLHAQGSKVAVLSRGYGRRNPKQARLVQPDDNWRDGGDEPAMLARRHPGARVCVGPSRAAAAHVLTQDPPDIYLVDDGFQHRQLRRDLDVVLIDVTQPIPQIFPLGLFREGFKACRRAHLVVLTRWDGHLDTGPFERGIRRFNSTVPILRLGFAPKALVDPFSGKRHELSKLHGKRVAAWSGIARPQKFFDTLESQGAHLVVRLALGDHQPLSPERADDFRERCREENADLIVTTEKDAVKLENNPMFGISLLFLSIEPVWEDAQKVSDFLARYSDGRGTHDQEAAEQIKRRVKRN